MAKAQTEIRSLARSHTESALKVLAGIMNEHSAPAAARVSAAIALLDRGWGKPDQHMTVDDNRGARQLSDAELDARIADIIGRLGVSEGTQATAADTSVIH